ncbi:MAG TPA: phosphatase, partial [Helicobacteraceae bacterium]|nr:phosphatase [Helicobacteraceae bacterium]
LVATAGTTTTRAEFIQGMDYKTYDPQKINGYTLSLQATHKALEGLLALTEEERAIKVGVGRENLISAGIIIVQALYKVLGFESAIVIDDSLREGLAMHYCQENET